MKEDDWRKYYFRNLTQEYAQNAICMRTKSDLFCGNSVNSSLITNCDTKQNCQIRIGAIVVSNSLSYLKQSRMTYESKTNPIDTRRTGQVEYF